MTWRIHGEFCLTGDHEVLTPAGWAFLSTIAVGATILAWKDGELHWEPVTDRTFVPDYTGGMCYFEGARFCQLTTRNHRLPYAQPVRAGANTGWQETTAETLVHERGWQVRLPVTGVLASGHDDPWALLAVALQADGSFHHQQVRFHLTRIRKQRRLETLLQRLGVAYSVRADRRGTVYTIVRERIAPAFAYVDDRRRFILPAFLGLSSESRRACLEESTEWDGHQRDRHAPTRFRFFQSSVAWNVEVLHTLAHTVGWTSVLRRDPSPDETRRPRTICTISSSVRSARFSSLQTVETVDVRGPVYCVTVPSGYFLVRYRDRISVTGNTHRPSTLRLSSRNPNLQNVVSDKSGKQSLAAGFRKVIVPGAGCRYVEVDFSGIEAVLSGWYMGDPDYIRLAKLGVHAYLTTHLVHQPASLDWSDDDLARCFKETKRAHPQAYDKAKRNVHGNNYGLSTYGMVLQFPEVFPSLREAEHVQHLYYQIAPKLQAWQKRTQKTAAELHYLGGSVGKTLRDGTPTQIHPFGYKHWFWSIYTFEPISNAKAQVYAQARRSGKHRQVPEVVTFHGRPFRIKLGEDAKRAIAFFPQSTAAAILAEVMLRLFSPESPDYIGDLGVAGRTPLRAPIHDSLLLEVPAFHWDRVVEAVLRVMTSPVPQLPIPESWRARVPSLGSALSIGVEAKWSDRSWGEMIDLPLGDYMRKPEIDATPIVQDGWIAPPVEDEGDREEQADLAREVVLTS